MPLSTADLENGDTVLVTRLTEASEGVRVREPSMADAPSEPQQPSVPAADAGE
jgi:hypothetical protein